MNALILDTPSELAGWLVLCMVVLAAVGAVLVVLERRDGA